MAQLKMYRLAGTPIKDAPLPEGYSISNYKSEKDKLAWVECCKNGLVGDNATEQDFDNAMKDREIDPYRDVFFLDYNGEHIGTVTAFVRSKDNSGDMHMVGIRTDFRGKGLSKYLSIVTCKHLDKAGVDYIELTTDEWRKGAIKGYLNAGFLPVKYDHGMIKRWRGVLKDLGVDSVQMLKNNTKPYKVIYRKK